MKKNMIKIVAVIYSIGVVGLFIKYNITGIISTVDLILVILAFTVFFAFLLLTNLKKEKTNEWLSSKIETLNQIIFRTKKSTEILVNTLPYGIASLDEQYKVTWCNDIFLNFFELNEHKEVSLSKYSVELENEIKKGHAEFDFTMNNKHFKVYFDSEYSTLALYDVTNEFLIRKQYNDSLLAIGILKFDLLDEIISGGDIIQQNEIQNSYFLLVTEYFASKGIYVQNVSNSSFMIVMKRYQLSELLDDDFSILKTVKDNINRLRVSVTLSIGLASYDEEYNILHQKAKDALVVAEQRGGDQAVIDLESEEVKYIGGTKETSEKRSRIRARITAGRISELIDESENILIITHGMSDTDAVGSSVGLLNIVKSHGKTAHIVYDEKQIDETAKKFIKDIKNFKDYTVSFSEAKSIIDKNTLVFVLDCNSEDQVMLKKFVEKSNNVVVIDHHRRNKQTFTNTVIEYIEPYASSTVELIIELTRFQSTEFKLSLEEATLMYSGLVIDSSNFTSKTGTKTFDAAALLRSYGADIEEVKKKLRDDYDTVSTISTLTNTLELYQNRFAFASTNEIISGVVVSKAANSILNIEGVDACFIIAQTKQDVVKVSARSLGVVNVQIIMEAIGGGGHFSTAAATIENKTTEEVKKMIKEVLINNQENK